MNEYEGRPTIDATPVIEASFRELQRKAFLVKAAAMGRDLLPDNEAVIANTHAVENNLAFMFREQGGEATKLVRDYLRRPGSQDRFAIQYHAKEIADATFEDTTAIDALDLITAIRGFEISCNPILDEYNGSNDKLGDLVTAFEKEAVQRLSLKKEILMLGRHSLVDLYERAYPMDSDNPKAHGAIEHALRLAQFTAQDRLGIFTFIDYANMVNAGLIDAPQTPYNAPLSDKQRGLLRSNAAETIEGLHLLRAYGITPSVVPARRLRLPYDVVMLPPVKDEKYEEDALTDFYFVEAQTEQLPAPQLASIPSMEPGLQQELTIDGRPSYLRLRLHANGQLSHGVVFHNVPGDITERSFADLQATNAYERINALCIALAYDSMVPEEVVRERSGGSVASQMEAMLQQAPNTEVFIKLLLHRKRELQRAGVSRQNRQPRGWPLPIQQIMGYTRRLQEGHSRTADAEEEARRHYESLGQKFTGLPDGITFARSHTRGTGPEQVRYRESYFRRTSRTAHFLGASGIRGARGWQRPR